MIILLYCWDKHICKINTDSSSCAVVTSQLVEETLLSTDSPCVAVTSQLVEESLLPDISSQTLKGTE